MHGFSRAAVDGNPSVEPKRHRKKPLQLRIALQGGGTLGAYGAGVLQALEEAGIEIVEASGLSAGALNLHVFTHAGTNGLQALWERTGELGDMLPPYQVSETITSFMPSSYLSGVYAVSGFSTPLHKSFQSRNTGTLPSRSGCTRRFNQCW